MGSKDSYDRMLSLFIFALSTTVMAPVAVAFCDVLHSISQVSRIGRCNNFDLRNKPIVNRDSDSYSYRSCGNTRKMGRVHDADDIVISRRDAGSKFAMVAATSSVTAFLAATVAEAITPEEASSRYDKYAPSYDDLDGGSAASALGIDEARNKVFSMARGDVLEIGVGTGLNLSRYRFGEDGVTSLTLVDISEGMLLQARSRVESLGLLDKGVNVSFVRADVTSDLVSLFGSNKFDSIVDSFSLCVMGNDGAKNCLKQLRDIVKDEKSGGRIFLIENTRSNNSFLGWYQDVTAVAAADAGGKGCLYNQDVKSMIQQTNNLRLLGNDSFAAGVFQSFICSKI